VTTELTIAEMPGAVAKIDRDAIVGVES